MASGLRVSNENIETVNIDGFEMNWCGLCRCPFAKCPACGINDCACGCPNHGHPDAKCKEWWDRINSPEFRTAQEAYVKRFGRQESPQTRRRVGGEVSAKGRAT